MPTERREEKPGKGLIPMPSNPDVVRLSVNLSPEAADALKAIADERHTTITEVVRDAIATEKFLQDEVARESKILVQDKSGNVREIVFRSRI
jgi:predicted transcriptional regulator